MADGNEHIQKYKSGEKVRIDELAIIEIVYKYNGLFLIVCGFESFRNQFHRRKKF